MIETAVHVEGGEMVVEEVTWGTWEELLLGGAVLRHGTRDWVTVAAELRARAQCPYTFTPEVCRAKYDDLQRHYPGCTTWFEEVRKKRMAELRHALEVSENSIGSLETKLETLKAEKEGESLEKEGESRANYASSQTESPMASQKSEGFESFSKESKDGLSAGSFTLKTPTNWSAGGQTPSPEEASDRKKASIVENFSGTLEGIRRQGTTLKKRRGLRKRKDCSAGESGFVDSAEKSSSDRSVLDNKTMGLKKRDEIDDLLKVFNFIVEHKCASNFRHRLDSQKRGRYKKMIRRHMDFDTLRSRITSRSIKSVTELFRDLLLLANNALVFYSKCTRERKSAVILRDLVTKTLREHLNSPGEVTKTPSDSIAPTTATVVAQPGKRNFSTKRTNSEIDDVDKSPQKGTSQPRRVGRKSNFQRQNSSPVKERKRVRTR